jgi:hypothetical protein
MEVEAMEQLDSSDSVFVVAEKLEIVSISLAGRPETEHLAPEVEEVLDELEIAHKTHRRARATRIASTARIVYFDGQLREPWMKLAAHVNMETNSNRESLVYKTLYPNKAPSELIKPVGGPEQAHEVKRVVGLLRTDPAVAVFAQHADPIEEALQTLTTEEARRGDLALKESAAELVLARVLARAREIYNALDRKLMEIFKDNKKLVRSFFG